MLRSSLQGFWFPCVAISYEPRKSLFSLRSYFMDCGHILALHLTSPLQGTWQETQGPVHPSGTAMAGSKPSFRIFQVIIWNMAHY